MANINNNSARQTHVSPGIYTKETDLVFASKSLGITKLGVVGETVKGPAFQPILIENWRQFQTYFGDTNTEKFRGSNYPKYELPYIAKEYLQQSNQLQVCRVLGLSGVNAGPAWIISAYKTPSTSETVTYSSDRPLVIAVLRSRGEHKKAAFIKAAEPKKGICEDVYEYDKIVYYAKEVGIEKSKSLALNDNCLPGFSTKEQLLTIDANNYGTFTLQVFTNNDEEKKYSVSLNPGEKNYIMNVLGGNPEIGDTEIYVEELYDVALKQLIERGELNTLGSEKIVTKTEDSYSGGLTKYPLVRIVPKHKAVEDILTEDESMLSRKNVGQRYLYSTKESVNNENGSPLTVHVSKDLGVSWTSENGKAGHIYTVIAYTTAEGTREYYYGEYQNPDGKDSSVKNFETEYISSTSFVDDKSKIYDDAVEVLSDGMYYIMKDDVTPVTLDFNNYKEGYRYASTPWVVSELKGSAKHVELTKLFRFHTISDGNNSNTEVKVSIENIDPTYGTFDVIVRSFYDTDASPVVLERYKGCDLIPGSQNYIALKIGSTDESYETKSNYITVEVNETDKTKTSIPAGFLGYPVRCYETGTVVLPNGDDEPKLTEPYLQYNTNVDEDIRINKQYFGLSDLTGIDEDVLKYKGVEAYNGLPEGLSPCFHLDSRIVEGKPKYADGHYYVENEYFNDGDGLMKQIVSVDGIEGYEWVTVGKGNTTLFGIEPRIGNEEVMANTIYEDKRYRKFTMAFYGGFDGWDYYRTSRSNGDDFKYQKYRGKIDSVSGEGTNLSIIRNPETYGFEEGEKVNNSDWYAYLSAARQFANPKTIDINVLATPGIDYVNNKMLVDEIIEMVEVERADSVYVVTTPDKPFGASDSENEMFTPTDAVYNLEDSDIDSNYTCTFYPWIKYFDETNSQYIYLPPTKDIVRNFAYTDNTAYPWFVAAGWNRGDINAVRPKKNLKLGEQDTLYNGRINFVNTFAQEGMKLWGDKNLQVRESQMNRISKRRLLIRIRKLLSIACIGLIFDPNDNTTAKAFKSAVNPILEDIRSKRGLIDYRIEVDDSQEARDRLSLPAKIYLKLQPNLEWIDINFVITSSGTNWDDI